MSFFEILFVLIVLIPILFLAVVTTKYVGGKAKTTMKGKYINVVETVSLGLDKKIHLLKVGEQFVLVASCGKNVEFMTNVQLEAYETTIESGNNNIFDFKNLFEKYFQTFKDVKNIRNKKEKRNVSTEVAAREDNTFKDNLQRIRKITSGLTNTARVDGDERTNEKQGARP